MIFAAGKGTRLKPITDFKPKALVEVGGKTLLSQVALRLKEAGFGHIVVNVHHFGEQIIQAVNEAKGWQMQVEISDERDHLRNTGGGLLYAKDLFNAQTPILIHNVDILSNVNLGAFYEQSTSEIQQGAMATLLVSQRKTNRYLLFDKDMRLVGWQNIATNEVRSPYKGLDTERCQRLAFSGIHVVSPQIFQLMGDMAADFPIMDFYLSACKDHIFRGIFMSDLHLLDVGKQDTLQEAEKFLANIQK